MNMKQFKYVLELADAKNFGKAAESLGISQPSLSQYVKNIEKQLGVELFDRSGAGVRLTDAGRVYIDAGKKILALEHQMQNEFSDLAEHKTGSIIVGTSPYRSATMMPSAIFEFHKKYPDMHVVVEEMTTSELMEGVEKGEFDFCLTVAPVDQRHLEWETVCEEELILAVPSSFEKIPSVKGQKKYPEIDAESLGGKPFVMLFENQIMQKALNNLCADCNLNLKKTAVVKSLEAQIAIVQAGVGMALVPAGIEKLCAHEKVVFYSFKQNLPKRQVVAVWEKGKHFNRPTEDLINIMKKIK